MVLTSDNFTSEISSGDSLVIFSSATSPKLNGILQKLSFFPRVHTVDIETQRDLASRFNIRVSPIVYHFKDGNILNTYKINQLEDIICTIKSSMV